MYGRKRRGYGSQRRREELKGYMEALVWIVTVICILVVAVAMAVKTTKASKVIAAEAVSAEDSVAINEKNILDVAQAVTSGRQLIAATAKERQRLKQEGVIVIDPGHGGMDGGCVSGDIVEKDINKEIAYQAARKLRQKGYQVVLVRKEDEFVDKNDRVEAANRIGARLYVSIHQNSCEVSSVSGIETWYDESDEFGDSKRLAQLVQQETVKATGAVDRELASDPDLCVTSKSAMPSCLIETGFLSNAKEKDRLASSEYQDQIAEGIAKGIDLYLNPKTMYLTFDDGPSLEYTDMVLDVRAKSGSVSACNLNSHMLH